MMRQYELVERVTRYNPQADEALLNKAYVYGMAKHGSQQRASGDPYFSHPLEVAAILTDMRLDDATIAVGLLHDTIEDTDATRAEIDKLFGAEIGGLVDGLTKIQRLDLISKEKAQAENLRKLLLAISDDVRVLLVKLADRLHNMRTLHHVPHEKRLRIAQETMDIYAPLAGRMGMREMREELEELAFKTINPEAYETISKRLKEVREESEEAIECIRTELNDRLKDAGIEAVVHGRQKRPFSIFNKMERKAVGFEQLSDIYGFRVVVNKTEQCYRALGVIHTRWASVPGRFKDFISTPKQNDYRSIHTTIIGPDRQRVELQIRTQKMHEIAEYGVAAHALYKDFSKVSAGVNDPEALTLKSSEDSYAYMWLQNLVKALTQEAQEGEDADLHIFDFVENTKLELFQDQVFCFTPKGRLVSLPRGANSIDFAYAVHTDVGNNCIGTKINGRIMPLITPLSNGDEVEILRSPAQKPLPIWENLVVTGKARAAIRRATREQARKQYIDLGKQILIRQFELAEKEFSAEILEGCLSKIGLDSIDGLYVQLGRGDLAPATVLEALFPDTPQTVNKQQPIKSASGEGWFSMGSYALKFKIPGLSGRIARGDVAPVPIPVLGLGEGTPIRFAPNGGAVPGDRIVGIITPGEGITVYPIQAESLSKFEDDPDLWLDVAWDIDGDSSDLFPARLIVSALNEPGTLAQVTKIIGDHGSNIERLQLLQGAADFTDIEIDLKVRNVKDLNQIMSNIKELSVTSKVVRINA